MRSPFKFLDSYGVNDQDIFFGRDAETEQLLQMVFQTPLLLLYGMSGTGKTSLVQCGLAGKFAGPDWLPLYIRRQENINDSLQEAIEGVWPKGRAMEATLKDQVTLLYRYYLRPVYLIFDQFEELFILSDEGHEEENTFTENLQALLEVDLPCKVILAIREEFIGQLYHMEQQIPSIYDFRLRVEPMGRARVKEVISKSFEQFSIKLDNPDKNLDLICDNLSDGKSGIQLPFLQIYLDQLYKDDFRRTYPEETELPEPLKPLTFQTDAIETFGNIEKVLEHFLLEQQQELEQLLKAGQYGELPPNTVRLLLDAFVTEEGTKRPVRYEQVGDVIHPRTGNLQLFPLLPKEALSQLLHRLIDNRLLRQESERLELSHDSLANLIDRARSDQQRRLNEQFNRLVTAYRAYPETKEYLSRRQLTLLDDFLPDLQSRLDEQLQRFIDTSRSEIDRHEKAELEKAQQQAAYQLALANEAKAALAQVREKNVSIFESFSALGIELIRSLDHAEALKKMAVAVEIDTDADIKHHRLTEPITELLFFFAESGRRLDLARTAAELLLKLNPGENSPRELQKCVQENWDQRSQFVPLLLKLPFFQKLQARYYPELVTVPLGKDGIFEMGSPKEEWSHQSDEQLHKVQLNAYQMSATPVTFYQFALFSEAIGRGLASRTPYWSRFGDHPVVSVSWYETLEYANWLNEQNGHPPCYSIQKKKNSDSNNKVRLDYLKWKVDLNPAAKGFRLPTEAEWELAARGGVGAPRTLFAGSDKLDEVGWYWENSGDQPLSGDWDLNRIYNNNGRTHTVKSKPDNGIGLYDMSGNVYEWCWDWYAADYYDECKKKGVLENPQGAQSSSDGRVIRGGSWGGNARRCRTACRLRFNPDARGDTTGFRLVFVP